MTTNNTCEGPLPHRVKDCIGTRVSPSLLGKTTIESARETLHCDHWSRLLNAQPIIDAVNVIKLVPHSDKPAFDHAVTNLLNLISRTYSQIVHSPANDATPALVFSDPESRDVIGDYLSTYRRPDTTAFMSAWADLTTAFNATPKKPFKGRQEFTSLIGVGRWTSRKTLDNQDQLLRDLSALKRYRPDLDTVHGMFVAKDTLCLMQHNACGAIQSCPVGIDHVETWVAFVVNLYYIYQTRDTRFAPARPDGLARWCIQTAPGLTSIFRPFYSGYCPGRVTWLAFEQDPASPELASGFLKVSWQDASRECNEPALLERAHSGGWLPGLVRHRWAQRLASKSVSLAGSTRVLEIVHLASIGDPMSQCHSALHLFKVAFDAIGVHENLMGEDIIHRDLSWFNVLCNPRHDPSTAQMKAVKPGVPTIEFILSGDHSEPCALVVDLDHGALMTGLYSSTHIHRKEKFGTPMFAAVELSSRYPEETGPPTLPLLKRLEAFDALPEQLRKRAFPDDDGKFMKVFNQVLDPEVARLRFDHEHCSIKTDPASLHRPRHDMESLFWIILWALLRASPLLGPPADLAADDALHGTANILLKHKLGGSEQLRNIYRRDPPVDGFHQLLSKFGGLLADMAAYIRVPWQLYEGKVEGLPPNHVHIAFRRMFLVEIYKLAQNNAAEDVLFNLRMPRSARDPWEFGDPRVPDRPMAIIPNSPALSPVLAPSGDGTERLESDDGIARPIPVEGAALLQCGLKRSFADRHQAFWDDRKLWFGVGDHQPRKPRQLHEQALTQTNDGPLAQTNGTLDAETDNASEAEERT